MAATTEVKPLSVKSLAPLSAAPRVETTFVAWAYDEAPAPGKEVACTAGTEVAFAEGKRRRASVSGGGQLEKERKRALPPSSTSPPSSSQGETLSVPGSSGATLTRSPTAITITVGGESGSLDLPQGASVSACQAGALYVVRAVDPKKKGATLLELAVNADTRCLAANGLSVNSIPGATSAERTGDPAFSATAGLPLPAPVC